MEPKGAFASMHIEGRYGVIYLDGSRRLTEDDLKRIRQVWQWGRNYHRSQTWRSNAWKWFQAKVAAFQNAIKAKKQARRLDDVVEALYRSLNA